MSADEAGAGTLSAAAAELLHSARSQAAHSLELAAAEARLAALSAVAMLALGVIAAALGLAGWTLLAVAAAQLGVTAGLSWPQALLALGALHIGGAWLAWQAAVRLSPQLTLPELRRALGAAGNAP